MLKSDSSEQRLAKSQVASSHSLQVNARDFQEENLEITKIVCVDSLFLALANVGCVNAWAKPAPTAAKLNPLMLKSSDGCPVQEFADDEQQVGGVPALPPLADSEACKTAKENLAAAKVTASAAQAQTDAAQAQVDAATTALNNAGAIDKAQAQADLDRANTGLGVAQGLSALADAGVNLATKNVEESCRPRTTTDVHVGPPAPPRDPELEFTAESFTPTDYSGEFS